MRRITARLFLAAALCGVALPAAAPSTASAKTLKKKKVAAKKAPVKKVPPVSAAHKKALAELYAGFKFGMSKEDVVKVLSKQIAENYDEQIKATTDIRSQDRLRADRKKEIARISSTFTSFEGKRTGWDVSIVEEEFAHKTGESMLERWENDSGKNQRRFFFFKDGKLYKMFVSLDVSILPADKKNFDTFLSSMTQKYGPGDVEADRITWRTPEFHVRAVDKLKAYDALALVIEEPAVKQELVALRKAAAPPPKETNPIIKAVIDVDGSDAPDVNANGGAVDAVIKAQGGTKKR